MAQVVHFFKVDTTARLSGLNGPNEVTAYTIAWADLTAAGFDAGDEVIILVRQALGGESSGSAYVSHWRQGSTFAGAAIIEGSQRNIEPFSNTTDLNHHGSWFAKLTLATDDNFYFAAGGSGGTNMRPDDLSVLIVKRGGTGGIATEDLLFAEVLTDVTTAPTAYDTNGASLTVPGAPSGNDWALFSMVQFDCDDGNGRPFSAMSWGGTDYGEWGETFGDLADIQVATITRFVAGVTSNTVLQARYRGSTATITDITVTRVMALRLSAFRDHAGVQHDPTDNDITLTTLDTYAEIAGLGSYAHGGAGANDLFVLMFSARTPGTDAVHSPYGRVQIDGADWPVAGFGRAGGACGQSVTQNDYPTYFLFAGASVSPGTLDIDADIAEDNDVSPNPVHNYHTLIAFSLELAGGGAVAGPGTGGVVLAGPLPTVLTPQTVPVGAGGITVEGHAPTFFAAGATVVEPGVGSVVMAGFAPNLKLTLNPETIDTITIVAAGVQVDLQVQPGVGGVVVAGQAPIIPEAGTFVPVPVGNVILAGPAPNPGIAVTPSPGVGGVVIQGHVPVFVSAVPNYRATDLRAVVVAGPQVDLTWVENAPDETGYTIERRIASEGGSFATLDTVAADAESYSDATVVGGKRYEYQIVVNGGAGDGQESIPVSVTIGVPQRRAARAFYFG